MEWFEERQRSDTEKDTKRTMPEGLWVKCTTAKRSSLARSWSAT